MNTKINNISPTFCAAKWRQVTIDLHHGLTHSCHHTKRLPLSIERLRDNLGYFHNTIQKKHVRNQMLNGIRPKECDYCWNIEDLPNSKQLSDRYIKSNDNWASFDSYREIKSKSWSLDISPTYLEVMFSTSCNLSCIYCASSVSSKVRAEIEKFGDYNLPHTAFRSELDQELSKKERAELKSLFMMWLSQILPKLHYLRITGGEPLLDDNTYETIDLINNSDVLDIFTLAINSNLSVNDNRFDKFTTELSKLNKIKKIDLFVSVDTFGKEASFIRAGLNYKKLLERILNIKNRLPFVNVIVMCTFNILSFYSFHSFLDDIIEIKKKHTGVILDISYLNNPPILSPNIATPSFIKELQKQCEFMKGSSHFSKYETNKLKRVLEYCIESPPYNLFAMQIVFTKYITEYAKRKNFDINKYIPYLSSFKSEALKNYKLHLVSDNEDKHTII